MALPPDITTITVTGTFLSITGTPLTGQVNFFVTTPVEDSTGKVILGVGTQAAPLNAAGSMSIVLPCTDNADLNPANFKYLVTEAIPGLGRAYYVQLPHTLGSTVDLSSLAPVSAPPPATAFASANTWTATQAFSGNAPIQIPAGAVAGDVLTSDSLGNASWQPAPGGLTGRLAPTVVKTADYTAAAGDYVPCDTTGGPFTVTLPAAPADLAVAGVKMVIQATANAVTVACAGSDVFNKTGGGTTLTLPLLNQGILLQYKASGGIWYVLADDLALSQLDARYIAATAEGAAGGVAQLDGSSLVPAAQMRPFNFRGPVAATTTYNPWDVIVYKGNRLLITRSFTTGTGNPPFVSAANYVTMTALDEWHAADYGVAGDGTTDNATALNNLITEVSAQGGGTIVLPQGNIMTSKTIVMQTQVHLRGMGWFSSAIKLLPASDCDVIQFFRSPNGTTTPNAFFCGLWNLEVHGNRANQTAGTYNYGINCTTNPLTTAASSDPDFDPTHILVNVWIKLTTGDGYFHNGRSGNRLIGVWTEATGGNGYSLSFDTECTDCHAQGAALGGFYMSHSSDRLNGCKSYNNGTAAAWTSGQNWAARQGAVYSGALYIALSALTNDTTPPPSDPSNWAPASQAAAQAYGHGFYVDGTVSGAEIAMSGCDSQQNGQSGYYLKSCTGVSLNGTVFQVNTGLGTATNQPANPNNCASLVLDGATGNVISLTSQDIGPAGYVMRVVSGAASNDVRMTGDTSAAATLSPDSLTLLGSGNSVSWNGTSLTSTLSGLADVTGTATNGQVPTWNSSLSRWQPVTPPSGNFDGIFGDGSDGTATLDGTATVAWATKAGSLYTMVRDCWLTGLTVNSGVTLLPNGSRIFCQGTVTNNGSILANGNPASGSVQGAVTPSNILGGGLSGGAGQTGNGTSGSAGTNATFGVGSGGAGGAGSSGTGGAAANAANSSTWMLRAPQILAVAALQAKNLSGAPSGGGGGGDGANKGGGGGGGGGLIGIAAWAVVNTGTLSAAGGTGGTAPAGNCGGGGGGGGGLILMYTLTGWTNTGTTAVAAGSGGTATGTGTNGSAGSPGNVVNIVVQ